MQFLLKASSLPVEAGQWRGHTVRALDGTYLLLPNSSSVEKEFPKRKLGSGKKEFYPRARLLAAVNVFTLQPTHAHIDTIFSSEREQALSLLPEFQKGDVFLLDRGFDGTDFFKKIIENDQNFICRLRIYKRHAGLSGLLLKSRKKDLIVEHKGLRLRLILRKKGKRPPLIIATTLLDKKMYGRKQLLALYLKRWAVETQFRRLKQNLNVLEFHAKTPNGIKQEVFASLLMLSLLSGIIFEAQSKHPCTEKYQINFTAAAEIIWRYLPVLITGYWQRTRNKKLLERILKLVSHLTEKIRPDRHFRRFSKQPENKWIKIRRSKNHVQKGHWKWSDAYR